MKRKMLITLALVCYAIIGFTAILADIGGKWTGSIVGPDGNDITLNYNFKIDGGKLTGTAFAQDIEIKLDSGKINGDDFTFKITNPEGIVIPHAGKYFANGDSISMNITYQDYKFHSTLKRADK
jgi:hypothetical protein